MMSPRVSVVIPVYNAEVWIATTLTSVCEQTYYHEYLDVVLVDDGSTDQSIAIAESILRQFSFTYCIIRTNNGGPSRARNLGWRQAQGEWIQFLDADDLLHNRKITLQMIPAIDLSGQIAVIYSSWQRIALADQTWSPVGTPVIPTVDIDPIADLLRPDNFIATGSQLFRRNWLERVDGFDERYWLIEDVNLLLRVAIEGGKFQYVPSEAPLFYYRQQKNSLSHRDQTEFVEGCVRNVQMAESYWRSLGELTAPRTALLAQSYFQAARYYAPIDEHEFERAVRKIETLVPGFVPSGPPLLRRLARLTGYRRAERIAVVYRAVKRRIRHGSRWLQAAIS
jgi:glycosyltransferase involved in cell wall biosynthesis